MGIRGRSNRPNCLARPCTVDAHINHHPLAVERTGGVSNCCHRLEHEYQHSALQLPFRTRCDHCDYTANDIGRGYCYHIRSASRACGRSCRGSGFYHVGPSDDCGRNGGRDFADEFVHTTGADTTTDLNALAASFNLHDPLASPVGNLEIIRPLT